MTLPLGMNPPQALESGEFKIEVGLTDEIYFLDPPFTLEILLDREVLIFASFPVEID